MNYMNNMAAMNIHEQGFVLPYVFISLGYITSSGIAGLYGKVIFTFSRK